MDAMIRYYPPDVLPPLWEKLEEMIDSVRLIATEEVFFELSKKDDELFSWAKKHSKMFIPIDENIQGVLTGIINNYPGLIDVKRNRSGADPWVIALAQIENCCVITGEHKSSNSNTKPHIPDVCDRLGIKHLNMLGLMRQEGWVFYLK